MRIPRHHFLTFGHLVFIYTVSKRSRPVARPEVGGGQNSKREYFFAALSWGPNLENVDKMYTGGGKFSKKFFLQISHNSEFCRAGGGYAPLATRSP